MGHFIAPDGPALLYVLQPDCMKVPDGGPPEELTIVHEIPEVGPHNYVSLWFQAACP